MSEIFPELDPSLAKREIGRRIWVFVPDNGHEGIQLYASRLAVEELFKAADPDNDRVRSETRIELAWFGAAYLVEVK